MPGATCKAHSSVISPVILESNRSRGRAGISDFEVGTPHRVGVNGMNKEEIHIRQLAWQEDELQQVLEIENASFNRFDAYKLEDFERWYHYNPDLCLVAEIGGRIAGYVITRILPAHGDLASLAIHPSYKRHGVATALLHHTAERVKEYGKNQITLEVRKTNTTALAFWQKMGFVPFASQPGFYEDGGEAILMRKWLDDSCFADAYPHP
jgi:ribosomal-protein-alanine N-acetyltransferase